MKKKIKDLTFFDVNECCFKYTCEECPLRLKHECYTGCIIYVANHLLPGEFKDFIEQEVEI